jgi:hypothetical protein
LIQMTEITPEIETLTVTFEEFKANFDHYWALRDRYRMVITHKGEVLTVKGIRLPGEHRFMDRNFFWFLDHLFPREPMDPESRVTQLLLDERATSRSS